MQRLHEDDLVGHVMEQGGWEVLSLPAIAEEDEHHVAESPFKRREFRRAAGEALQKERESLSALETIRATIGEGNFAPQYQQRPAPAGGGMIKAAWFPRFAANEAPSFDRIVQSWDAANKASELADYSVCTTWGMKGPHLYLLNVLRKKLAFPDLKRAVLEQDRLFRPEVILIEDKASGTQLIQELIAVGLPRVKACKAADEKMMRAHAQTATIENGFVHLPQEAHWLADYLAELTVFPAGRHDDQVDSTVQFLAWAKAPAPRMQAQGMFDYWTQPERKKIWRPPDETMVRMRQPRASDDDPHASDKVGVCGTLYPIKDGIVELEAWKAKLLVGMGFVRV